jgi:dihydrofolate reductase
MSLKAHPDTIETKTGQTPRRVVAGYFLPLDGVAEAPDRSITAWDNGTDASSGADLIGTQDPVIFGRRSYDEWGEFWPGSEIQPFASFINAVPSTSQRRRRSNASGPTRA